MKIGKRYKWLSLFVIVATLVSMLLMQAGIASAATLQPSINPAGGTYTSAQTVTIYNIANGDTAYYTTDGSNPETSSTRIAYTGPFTVYQSETVQAIGYDSTAGWSSVTSAYFSISGSSTIEAPYISPDGGSFTTAQTVTIGDIYGTAYYTTDGSNPESSSTRIAYTGTFTVYQSETIEAVNYSSAGWSTVTSAYFSISGSSSTSGSNSAEIAQLEQRARSCYKRRSDGAGNADHCSKYNNWKHRIQIRLNLRSRRRSSLRTAAATPTAQTVTIGDIDGTAYYTTDGSNPETSSTRTAYNGAFTV